VTLPDGSPGAALYEGQLDWQDGPFRFHGNVEPLFDFLILPGSCQDFRATFAAQGSAVEFGGTYYPKSGGGSGQFFVMVDDMGTPGANGDAISIFLAGGQYDGYSNAGTVQGGNI